MARLKSKNKFAADNLPKARFLILVAMMAFSVQDLLVKLLLTGMSVWQMQMLRSIGALVFLALLAMAIGQRSKLMPTQWVWPVVRAVFMAGAYVFFYISLPFLSLSQASATFFIGPLLITVLAAIFLGERIGWRRLLAVLVGFAGVVVIVQPWGKQYSPVMLFPAAAAACYALGVIITRWRCRSDPAFSLSMMHNFFYALIGAEVILLLELWPVDPVVVSRWPVLLSGWSPLSLVAVAYIVVVALAQTMASLSSIKAYQLADAGKIAPLEYSYLAFAPLWDLLVFSNPPSLTVVVGMALITAGGVMVSWREGRPARPKPQNFGEDPWVAERNLDKNLFGTRIQIDLKFSRTKPRL
ncbi:MAG TPA: DMT family transporter [Rhizobiales bacterium]|nr:DMT family transporter [Hyphomicrobiales bacterium]